VGKGVDTPLNTKLVKSSDQLILDYIFVFFVAEAVKHIGFWRVGTSVGKRAA